MAATATETRQLEIDLLDAVGKQCHEIHRVAMSMPGTDCRTEIAELSHNIGLVASILQRRIERETFQ